MARRGARPCRQRTAAVTSLRSTGRYPMPARSSTIFCWIGASTPIIIEPIRQLRTHSPIAAEKRLYERRTKVAEALARSVCADGRRANAVTLSPRSPFARRAEEAAGGLDSCVVDRGEICSLLCRGNRRVFRYASTKQRRQQISPRSTRHSCPACRCRCLRSASKGRSWRSWTAFARRPSAHTERASASATFVRLS